LDIYQKLDNTLQIWTQRNTLFLSTRG